MSKRKADAVEFEDVSQFSSPLKKAKVEGMISKLSPMKKARSSSRYYFDGEIVGRKGKVRVHGYDEVVRAELEKVAHICYWLGIFSHA